jgi:hypothetical protein
MASELVFPVVPNLLDILDGERTIAICGTTRNTYCDCQESIMSKQQYTASKTRSQGRTNWSITFRHPLRKDPKGKQGLKIHRGLATADDGEADRLVAEMNQLLGDPSLWDITRKAEAERRFSPIVVDAFYEAIETETFDPWALRDSIIPLPTKKDRYARVLNTGTTGVGKTSLARCLLGLHPDRDRFPSTSTAKTTTADIEVVTTTEGTFTGVVTFHPQAVVHTNVHENVVEASAAAWEGAEDEQIADRLLIHRDETFRLNYVLGSWQSSNFPNEQEEDWQFNGTQAETSLSPEDDLAVDQPQRNVLQRQLEGYVQRIRAVATQVEKQVNNGLGVDVRTLSGTERDAAQELFQWELEGNAEFEDLVSDIIEDIRRRFDQLPAAGLKKTRSGWPEHWHFETSDRNTFLKQIRWFTSNYAPAFGRLLTPLVQGVRVRGPLFPEFTDVKRNLVLMDGQGLGHRAETASSVSTNITGRFTDVDVILLVDSVKQPMQAAPLAMLRSIIAQGYQDKLAIAFTHFDTLSGPNLLTVKDKRNHVMASIRNALGMLSDALGRTAVSSLERDIDRRCFMLGWLDKWISKEPKGLARELQRLLDFFEQAIRPESPMVAEPWYDSASLVFAVQAATQEFQACWEARLGFRVQDQVHPEHWTRVKALNRRIALEMSVEYDTLRPVADLHSRLTEAISKFLATPVRWKDNNVAEEEKERAVSHVRRHVAKALHQFAPDRLIRRQLKEWVAAFEHWGIGSATRRANEIKTIYNSGAPVPGIVVNQASQEFLTEVRRLVHEAIEKGGGKIQPSF